MSGLWTRPTAHDVSQVLQAAMGFEPMNNGFAIRSATSLGNTLTHAETSTCSNADGDADSDVSLSASLTDRTCTLVDPGLAAVVDAWAGLPEAVRAGIVATVQAVTKTSQGDKCDAR